MVLAGLRVDLTGQQLIEGGQRRTTPVSPPAQARGKFLLDLKEFEVAYHHLAEPAKARIAVWWRRCEPGPRADPQQSRVGTPFQKTLESFEFKFQPSIDPKLIRELATGRYIQSGDNLLFLGPPGVGRSHLAIALGTKAYEQGIRTLFVTATALITTLGNSLAEGQLEERLKLLTQPSC